MQRGRDLRPHADADMRRHTEMRRRGQRSDLHTLGNAAAAKIRLHDLHAAPLNERAKLMHRSITLSKRNRYGRSPGKLDVPLVILRREWRLQKSHPKPMQLLCKFKRFHQAEPP